MRKLLCVIYKFLSIIRITNLRWGYVLINEIDQWCYQIIQVAFSKNVFRSVNCTLFLQLYTVTL